MRPYDNFTTGANVYQVTVLSVLSKNEKGSEEKTTRRQLPVAYRKNT
jgi:hypothetical protein